MSTLIGDAHFHSRRAGLTRRRGRDTLRTVSDTPIRDPEEAGFDEILARLRTVVDRLEQGNLNLEESLRAYEEGVGLARRGHQLLDGAEKRVELLVRGARGELETAPLDGDAGDDADGE